MFNLCILENEEYINNTKNILNLIFKNNNVDYSIDSYTTLNELEDTLKNNSFKYHCVIIDTFIYDQTSFDLVSQINKKYSQCHIIYITNSLEYSRYISHTKYSYFIYRNDIETELLLAINKVLHEINDSLIVQLSLNRKTRLIPLNDILYIESHLHNINIFCANEIIECHKKLNDISKFILSYPQFVRCHNSYIINMNHIKEYTSANIIMKNNSSITISRTYKDKVRNQLEQFYNPFIKM